MQSQQFGISFDHFFAQNIVIQKLYIIPHLATNSFDGLVVEQISLFKKECQYNMNDFSSALPACRDMLYLEHRWTPKILPCAEIAQGIFQKSAQRQKLAAEGTR